MINWKTFKKLSPWILLLAAIIFLVMQDRSNDTFIEDRNREFKQYQDSVNNINDSLYNDISIRDERYDSVMAENDSIDIKITSLDNSIDNLNKKFNYEINSIDDISADSNLLLLTNFLSTDISD